MVHEGEITSVARDYEKGAPYRAAFDAQQREREQSRDSGGVF